MYEFNDSAYEKVLKFKPFFEDFLSDKISFDKVKNKADECDIGLSFHCILTLNLHQDIDMEVYRRISLAVTSMIEKSFLKPKAFVQIIENIFSMNINDLIEYMPKRDKYNFYIANNPKILIEIIKLYENSNYSIESYNRLRLLDVLLPTVNSEEIDIYSINMQGDDNKKEIASIMSYRLQGYFDIYKNLNKKIQLENFINMKKVVFTLLNYDEKTMLGIYKKQSAEKFFKIVRNFYLNQIELNKKNINNDTINYIEQNTNLSQNNDIAIWFEKINLEKRVKLQSSTLNGETKPKIKI